MSVNLIYFVNLFKPISDHWSFHFIKHQISEFCTLKCNFYQVFWLRSKIIPSQYNLIKTQILQIPMYYVLQCLSLSRLCTLNYFYYKTASSWPVFWSKPMKVTTFMRGNLPNLPHLFKPSSEPGSSVPYLFWTLPRCT